jgi:hypothetical protein
MPTLHLLFGRMPELHSPASHTQSSAPHVRRSPSTDQPARLAARPARTPRQAACRTTTPRRRRGSASRRRRRTLGLTRRTRGSASRRRRWRKPAALAASNFPCFSPISRKTRSFLERRRGHWASLKRCFAWRRGLTAKTLLSFDAKRTAPICCLHDCTGERIAPQSEPVAGRWDCLSRRGREKTDRRLEERQKLGAPPRKT